MARRSVEEAEYLLDQPAVEESTSEERPVRRQKTPRGQREREKEDSAPRRRRLNLLFWTLPFVALAAAFFVTIAFHRVEAFLLNDTRFHLIGSTEFGKDPANLTIEGLRRASKAEVYRIFEQDFGRSLYLFPVAERGRQLLAVDWVRQATVSRRWPNRVHVLLSEREPAAYAQINVRDSAPRFHLIDGEGVLLPIPKGEKFPNFVVILGLNALQGREADTVRKTRVQQVEAMLKEAGSFSSYISEVDVRDPGNLQVAMQMDGRVVLVRLGERNFRTRIQNFLTSYPDIQRARPKAGVFDLRIDDRITTVDGGESGE